MPRKASREIHIKLQIVDPPGKGIRFGKGKESGKGRDGMGGSLPFMPLSVFEFFKITRLYFCIIFVIF